MSESQLDRKHGPLHGIRIVEFASIGPGPFAAMLLSDLGADVVRIDRPDAEASDREILNRGRRSICLDLKRQDDAELALRLIERADALIEGYRPGVMERLGLGPDVVSRRNPRLIYGRMTGWGQTGPLAHAAGHDINYIALSGALASIGPAGGKPCPPLNLVGDLGGGALYLVMGILAAIIEAKQSGQGQTIDCAVLDGTASLMSLFYSLREAGKWQAARGENFLDGGAPFYACYECADGRYISLGALEAKFYEELRARAGLLDPEFAGQDNPARWPSLTEKTAAVFRTKTRDEWCRILEGTDVCFAPVLEMSEAPDHPHNAARGVFDTRFGIEQPAPAPRFSRTSAEIRRAPPLPDQHRAEILADWAIGPIQPP